MGAETSTTRVLRIATSRSNDTGTVRTAGGMTLTEASEATTEAQALVGVAIALLLFSQQS